MSNRTDKTTFPKGGSAGFPAKDLAEAFNRSVSGAGSATKVDRAEPEILSLLNDLAAVIDDSHGRLHVLLEKINPVMRKEINSIAEEVSSPRSATTQIGDRLAVFIGMVEGLRERIMDATRRVEL